MHSVAIYGGAFDPVHHGHIQTALHLQTHFHFDEFYFLPCKDPVLKPATYASSQQRVAMLQLALKDLHEFLIDLREINRKSPSYMAQTLKSIREKAPDKSINLIIGYDAFLTLDKWHQWQDIIKLANLIVINRLESTQEPIPLALNHLLECHEINSNHDLLTHGFGAILFYDAGHYAISSTLIRDKIKKGEDVSALLPKLVDDFLRQQGLYQ